MLSDESVYVPVLATAAFAGFNFGSIPFPVGAAMQSSASNSRPDHSTPTLIGCCVGFDSQNNEPAATKLAVCKADLSRDDLTGLELAQYHLGKRIGAGGMGLVYEAVHQHLRKRFAIKFITANFAGNPTAESRFLHEILAIGKLDHPNLIVAVDAGVHNGLQYCVTELLEGKDLSAWIEILGPMPVEAACEVIRQAALGLAHAHDRGFVHRDVKPGNLFLATNGRIKVLDFGIASYANDQSNLTSCGQFMGSIDFVAPEQASDARQACPASDLYSLACTLIYLLSGHPPYPNSTHPDPISKLKACAVETPKWWKQNRQILSPSLVDLVERTIEKSVANRLSSAAIFAFELTKLASSQVLVDWMTGQKSIHTGFDRLQSPENLPFRCRTTKNRTRWTRYFAGLTVGVVAVTLSSSIAFQSLPDAHRQSNVTEGVSAEPAMVIHGDQQTDLSTPNSIQLDTSGTRSVVHLPGTSRRNASAPRQAGNNSSAPNSFNTSKASASTFDSE